MVSALLAIVALTAARIHTGPAASIDPGGAVRAD